MTGWLLIISLLLLGGVLSTLGDRLGSRVGKARLSIFNLRPRRTAVLITVFTGSLISALSLGLMLLVSRQLRVGLFQIDAIQAQIKSGEKELRGLEQNLIALRRGAVVISSGQRLATAKFRLQRPTQAKKIIDGLLQEANLEAYRRVRPGEKPNRQILLVPKGDIKRLEEIITKEGNWVVNIRSAVNVLLGEKTVFAFPEVRPNINIVRKGEVLATTTIKINNLTPDEINKRINLLLASTLAEIKRRGSLSSGLQFDPASINSLAKDLRTRKKGIFELEAMSLKSSDTSDSVFVLLQITNTNLQQMSKQN